MAESNAEPLSAKDYGPGGNGGRKATMGILDVTRDLAALENNIPLSPQWLYAKSSDSKTGISATSGDTHTPSSLPQVSFMDSIQGDARRLEGSQDKKDWRRNAPDVENSRRWREEERETGLLGRRERRKEGDRETEYRKNDRRSDNAPTKEAADFRATPSSERRHEAASRTSNHESRRDSKWSSRWGPEDKEDLRIEKKSDTDKEESHVEKQPVIGSSDKWRPLRQRQEIHSSGSAVYRAAPGVGAERARVDGPNIRFAVGRGRAKVVPALPCSLPPSSAPIGAASSVNSALHEKYRLSADTFQYRRGKLLDIYRKNKAHLTTDNTPEVFVEAPQITLSNYMNPLAFTKPDSEEVAVLEDIWKGKVKSSEACDEGEGIERVGDCATGPNIVGELCKNEVTALFNEKDLGMTSAVSKDGSCSKLPYSLPYFEETDDNGSMKNDTGSAGLPDSLFPDNSGPINSKSSLDIYTKLPDDSSSLFDSSFIQENVSGANQHQSNDAVIELTELGAPTMLSLSYMDPQGDIQGPFLVEDIITWHAEGFFGTDLPVRLSDAPGNTPFRPLGEVIAELSWKPESSPLIGSTIQSHGAENPRVDLDAIAPTSELSKIFSTGSQDPVLHHGQPRMSESNAYTNFHYEKSPGIRSQNFHDLSGQDSEEVFYNRRSETLIDPFGKLANEMHGLPRTQSANQILPSARGQAISFNQKIPTNDDVNALGLSWSELRGSHLNPPLSTNLSAAGDQGHIISPFVADDPSQFRHKEDQLTAEAGIVTHDAWPSNYRRNTSSNVPWDGNRLAGLLPETNRFNLEEQLLSQQLQNQQLQHPLNPLGGGDASRFRHKEVPFSVEGELLTHDSWPTNYKRNTTNLHDASRLTRLMAETNHFNLEDHLLSQQFQNQELQQQRLGRQHLEQQQGPLHHQQSINQVIDMERLLKLQFQQQQHLHQLGQQQQLHQQQQQIHHRMQLLQEQHQRQQHQLLIEQLLHQQQRDSSLGASLVDTIRGDQIFNRQHLNELQQQTHRLPMDHDASLDQRILDKFGRHSHQEQYNELLDILSHPSHRNGLSVEQQLLLGHQHEQLRSRQFPIDPRQQQGINDERLVGGVWSVDESGQFVMEAANSRKPPLERISSFEQQHHHDLEAQFYDRMQRENYGLNSQHIERSTSVPRPKMDMLESHGLVSSAAHMGQYPSGVSPQHNRMPSQISGTYVDATARNWSGPTGQLENSLQDSQHIQFHLGLDKQKRDIPAAFSIENPNDWPSHIGEGSSSHGLPKLYLPPDKMGSADYFSENSLVTKSGQTPQGHLTDINFEGPTDAFEASRRLPFRTSSGASSEHNQFFLTTSGNENEKLAGSIGGEMPKDGIDFSELNQGSSVRQLGTQRAAMRRTVLGASEAGVEQAEVSAIDLKSLNAKGSVRHASFGGTGGGVSLYNCDRGVENQYVNEMMNDRMSGIFARGPDSSSVMRTHDILLSQGALTESVPVPVVKGNSSTSFARSDEMRRDSGGNMAGSMPDTSSSSRNDTGFNRTLSYNNVDAPETSFIDMLKGTKKHITETDTSAGSAESQDTGPGGRSSNKKKGKKGRTLDPSLLGFKVNSNRILKGEIQLPDD